MLKFGLNQAYLNKNKFLIPGKSLAKFLTLTCCLLLVVSSLIFLFSPQFAFADVGNTTNYRGGGSSRGFGGGGGSLYSFYMVSYIFQLIFRYPVIGIPLLIFIAIFYFRSQGKGRGNGYRAPFTSFDRESSYDEPIAYNEPPRRSVPNPLSPHIIADIGEDFDENIFLSKVSNMFVQLQEAWTKKRWELVRSFEHDTIFQVHKKQLEEFIRKNQTNVMEDIAVLNSYISNYDFNPKTMVQTLQVVLDTKFRDYIVDDQSGKVLEGRPDRVIYSTYIWTLVRTKNNFKTIDPYNINSCPHCGAPTANINESGVCSYCGSNITKGDYDWVLVKIDKLAQR